MTQHWEDMKLDDLRKLAKNFGVVAKGLRKADLIHQMRSSYWDQVKREKQAARKKK